MHEIQLPSMEISAVSSYCCYQRQLTMWRGGVRVSSARSPPTGEISGVRSREGAGAFAGRLREPFALANFAAGVAFTGVSANIESTSDIISPIL
jgi:hypothetical protein